jgi:hypothetical protein
MIAESVGIAIAVVIILVVAAFLVLVFDAPGADHDEEE